MRPPPALDRNIGMTSAYLTRSEIPLAVALSRMLENIAQSQPMTEWIHAGGAPSLASGIDPRAAHSACRSRSVERAGPVTDRR